MNAQAILDKIAADARDAARRIQDEARQKADEALKSLKRKLEADEAALRAQAERDGAEQGERMHRMASLENRKELLAQKRTVIDAAFARAKALFDSLDTAQMRAFFLERAAESATGGETLILGENQRQWADDRFLAEAHARIGGEPVRMSPETRPGVTGFLLRKDGTEINCTLEAILGDLRIEMETDVARLLFGEV